METTDIVAKIENKIKNTMDDIENNPVKETVKLAIYVIVLIYLYKLLKGLFK